MNNSNTVGEAAAKISAVILAWLASWQAADVQVVVAIVGGIGVAVYTWLNAYVLWRDKVTRKQSAGGTD